MTSRCSFELVQKAATVGIPLLATMSAPTALAFDLARAAGMTLAARSRAARSHADGVLLFR
jgi:FdhD protein